MICVETDLGCNGGIVCITPFPKIATDAYDYLSDRFGPHYQIEVRRIKSRKYNVIDRSSMEFERQ